jgi:hypothetical protein
MTANDADLVRYIDGELDEAGRARVEAALADDIELAARLETLRRRGTRLRRMLQQNDPPPAAGSLPERGAVADEDVKRAGSPALTLMRAAAVLLVLVGIFSLVPPLRAWIVDRWERIASPAETTPPGQPPLLRTPDTVAVTFPTEYQSFDFELIARQQTGTLRIRVADVDQVAAEMYTRTNTETFFKFPAGLRVINAETSVADYDIVIPSTVRTVRVTIGAQRIAAYSTRQEEGKERVFELGH